jgi:hypothetical protein
MRGLSSQRCSAKLASNQCLRSRRRRPHSAAARAGLAGRPTRHGCKESTHQHAVDDARLSCNPLRATRDRGSSACQSASCHQMEYLVPAPQWSPRSGGRGCRVARLDHPFDHPDDPTGSFWSRLDRRGTQREQARSVWSRPDRRRAPVYGSGALIEALIVVAARHRICSVVLGGVGGPLSGRRWLTTTGTQASSLGDQFCQQRTRPP